jgi:2-oxoglutarate dehydrogenase E2 component (dihydrolipoamide succinyltransferase)
MSIEVRVPTLGESVTEATIATWFKKPGDKVALDEMLCELETDKVTVEVPSPAAGTLGEIIAGEGSTVGVNALLATIAEGAAAAPAAKEEKKAEAPAPKAEEPAPAPGAKKDVEDAPSAKKAMAEAGLTRDQVEGTGRDGRVMKEDVARAASAPKQAPAAEPASIPRGPVAAEDAAREERVKMSRLRQTIARRLKESQETAAQLTTFNDVDMSAVMAARSQYKELFEKKHGVKLGFMGFFVKAAIQALREVPEVNAEIDGQDIIYKNHYDIGIAVGTEKGLVVPVVRDADTKSLAQIEKDIGNYGRRARDGDLKLEEMQGGTFTITNGGVYGSLMSTPILNMPQSGILGMHRIEKRPIAVGDKVEIRPMMYLALSYDHRIVDGKGAVTFLVRIKENLEDPQRLLLDL